jgi:hypothetical protein
MSGHCCFLLVALAYLQGIEGGVVRPLPHPDAQKLPVVPQENGLSGKEQHGPPAGSDLATERPSHNLTVQPFRDPEYPDEGDIIRTPEEELIYVSTFLRPPLWSSVQSSWPQIQRPGFDSRHCQIS